MGKASTITFISLVASIIFFSIFISLYPNGLKISEPYGIYYEGNEIKFYGGIEGDGEGEIISVNSFFYSNVTRFYGNFSINGNISFFSENAVLIKEEIFSHNISFYGKNCWFYDGNEKIFYENIDGRITGNSSIIFNGELSLKESSLENKSSPVLPSEFTKVFPLKFNKIFYIDGGRIWIEGKEINFSKYVFFRGEGKFNTKGKFSGNGYFIAIDNEFYDEEKKIYFIPVKIIVLWIIAVVMFIVSLLLKKNIFLEKDKLFFGFSIVAGILFFAISLFLWNCEMERIFGLNLFEIREITIGNILFLSLAIVPYLVAVGIIGFPLKVAIASFFEIFGMGNIGKGIGRCAGLLMTAIWGISLITSILNITLSSLLRLI
ncbi:MAG TPA: hypothetical protein ENI33_05485 [Thermoplasmatales archaeon]|nr:hypothetical protein [Thermoplasmatales archaeon]